jgi:membrane associated rhomboid family serine protease/Flp pilus assembly protein TadD
MAGRLPTTAELLRRPATAGLAVLAIAVGIADAMGLDVAPLTMRGDALLEAPWTAITSVLVHVSFLHLAFNLYWLLAIGAHFERELGSVRAWLLYALWGIVASLAEHALFRGGVGLSGIGYGLVAYGLVRARTARFDRTSIVPLLAWDEVVDARTVMLFAAWFLFCIGTTITGVFPVGNVAHGVGAIAGGLSALALAPGHRAVGLLGVVVVVALAVTIDVPLVRDRVNLSGMPALEAERRGLDAIEAGDYGWAIEELEHAVALGPDEGRRLHNLSVAYDRADRIEALCATYDRIAALDHDRSASSAAPYHAMDRTEHAHCHGRLGVAALEADRNDDAIASLETARAIAEDDGYVLYNLAVAYRRAGREDEACAQFIRASDALSEANDAAARCLSTRALASMDAAPPDDASAEADLARARRLVPDAPGHAYNHGVVLTRLGRDREAIDALSRAEREGHGSAGPALRYVLARGCRGGDCEACRELTERGAAAAPCPRAAVPLSRH